MQSGTEVSWLEFCTSSQTNICLTAWVAIRKHLVGVGRGWEPISFFTAQLPQRASSLVPNPPLAPSPTKKDFSLPPLPSWIFPGYAVAQIWLFCVHTVGKALTTQGLQGLQPHQLLQRVQEYKLKYSPTKSSNDAEKAIRGKSSIDCKRGKRTCALWNFFDADGETITGGLC